MNPTQGNGGSENTNLLHARPRSYKQYQVAIQSNIELYQEKTQTLEAYVDKLSNPQPARLLVRETFSYCHLFEPVGYSIFSEKIDFLIKVALLLLSKQEKDEALIESVIFSPGAVELAMKVASTLEIDDLFQHLRSILELSNQMVDEVLEERRSRRITRSLSDQDIRIARLVALGKLFDSF